jgi:protease YdgD
MRTLVTILFVVFCACPVGAEILLKLPPIPKEDRATWQAVGQVSRGETNARGLCTGTLIAPDMVITAAHCVANRDGVPALASKLNFAAGLDGTTSVAKRKGKRIMVHPAYYVTEGVAKAAYDVAILVLEKPIARKKVKPVALADMPPTLGPITILGYQAGRADTLNGREDCLMVQSQPAYFGLNCGVISGNSGGPALQLHNGEWQIVGVVTAKVGYRGGAGQALVARISPWVFEQRDAGAAAN